MLCSYLRHPRSTLEGELRKLSLLLKLKYILFLLLNRQHLLWLFFSYVFNVVYRKGLRQSNASIVVTLKPGEPAEVKLDQQQIRNKIILKGYVKTASSANVTWSCSKQEGNQYFCIYPCFFAFTTEIAQFNSNKH